MKTKNIDTIDLQKRLDELDSLRDDVATARESLKEAGESDDSGGAHEMEAALTIAEIAFDTDEQTELAELEAMAKEIGREFPHGVKLIHEREFDDHARTLAEEAGDVLSMSTWPCTCIDWSKAAKELKHDYSLVTYQENDYYYRALT